MRDDDHRLEQDAQDKTISQLLLHLQQIRQAVPVNYQLKAELKQRLMEQMKQMEAQNQAGKQPHSESPSKYAPKWKRWMTVGIGAMVVAITALTMVTLNNQTFRLEEIRPLVISNTTYSIEEAAISPLGDQVALLTNESKVHTYLIEERTLEKTLELPQTTGNYQDVVWSPNGKQLAVVEQTTEIARVWVIDMDQQSRQYGSRLIWEDKNVVLRNLSWNPQGGQITFTREQTGKQTVQLLNTQSLTVEPLVEGSQASWSTDGNLLALVQNGQVVVMNPANRKEAVVDQGTSPSWLSDHELSYIGNDQQLMGASYNRSTDSLESIKNMDTNHKWKQASWSLKGNRVLLHTEDAWLIAERD